LALLTIDKPLYLDTGTGYLWVIQDPLTAVPSATGAGFGSAASSPGLFYTTVNCSGTAYAFVSSWGLPNLVYAMNQSNTYYTAGNAAAVTTNSELLNGVCYSVVQTTDLYLALGPLTPPTLASGPWHLESR
jgi:hypothetical protein